ncbi:MAG: tetratricopeptide repeat protein, partial [Leptolyngbyaceae cyanobacterium SM2_3_12]|nr:tetratricopeptide repeat protein [Leptolyngbyaceae cyanobacterium SM2_3_12]
MVRGTETGQLQWLDAQGVTTTMIPDAHIGLVSAVVVSPDGQTVVSSGADGTIRRWDRNGNSLGDPIQGSDGPILSLALSPDGQTLISGNADGTVERWSVATGAALGAPILAHTGPVQAINYPAGGQNFITGSSDGSLAFWNADGSSAGQVPNAHQGGVTHITSSPDGQVFTTTGSDGTLRQWDRATLQPRGPAIQAHSSSVNAVTYSPNGGTIATAGADGTLQLWEPNGTPRLAQPIQLNAPASSLGFNPMGQLIVGTTDGRVELRDPQGELISATAPSTDLSPDLTALWQRMQNLPRNIWWLLAAVPVLLFLAGLIGALLGIKRKPGDGIDIEGDPVPGSGLGIDFSGTGSDTVAPIGGSGLPPEAGLIPIEGSIEGTSTSKLEQAKADLAEGRRLMREGRYDSALIYFNSAIEATEIERIKASSSSRPVGGINAIAAQAQAQRGHALAMLGQANDAMDSYNYALELDSSTLDAWVGKGRLLTTMGRYEEAIFCFDSALEINQSSAAAWSGKGQALMQMGRQAEGQVCLSQAASLGGDESGSITLYPPGIPTYPQPDPNIQGNISPYPIPQPYPNGEPGSPTPVPGAGSISPRPVRPPEEQPGYGDPSLPSGYDPDIPLELQQMVMGLPSADAAIAGMVPGSFDIPPDLKADIAHLPDQAEDAFGMTDPNAYPGNGFTPTPRPVPPSSLEEDLINQVDLSAATDMDEMLQGLPIPGDGYGNPSDFMGMQPDPGLPPVPSYPTPVPTPGPQKYRWNPETLST